MAAEQSQLEGADDSGLTAQVALFQSSKCTPIDLSDPTAFKILPDGNRAVIKVGFDFVNRYIVQSVDGVITARQNAGQWMAYLATRLLCKLSSGPIPDCYSAVCHKTPFVSRQQQPHAPIGRWTGHQSKSGLVDS